MSSGLALFTAIHTAISLLALVAGIPVVAGLLGRRVSPVWTSAFLALAIATSVTGFFFPFHGVTPAIVVGVIAFLVLAAVLVALRSGHLAGKWRWVYALGMVLSLYFLVFVTVAQAFSKIPPLHALAPTQSEPPFAVAQLAVLAVFAFLGLKAVKRFNPAALQAA